MKETVGVIGLGYVGLPLAISFAKKWRVIGYDANPQKIKDYQKGIDCTQEVGDDQVQATSMTFTADATDLKNCDYLIIAVPTPIGKNNIPDLTPIEAASQVAGKNLKDGCIVIYESTVYPGVTEEICAPILEKYANKRVGQDFKIAYSPERINPGDTVHRFETITKIVSGMDEETLDKVDNLYQSVLQNGTYRAESIKIAEAAKVIENTQRDINIAFVNELAVIFHQLGIDTQAVLDAAATKWNFLKFHPGLVGGHCIGIDPFYLTYKSQEAGHISELILSSRRVNDEMGAFIADQLVKEMIKQGLVIKGSTVLIYGLTFKENVGDLRNSKVIDVINQLETYDINVVVRDCYANKKESQAMYGIDLEKDCPDQVDAIIMAVGHNEYRKMSIATLKKQLKEGTGILVDIKRLFKKQEVEQQNINYWGL